MQCLKNYADCDRGFSRCDWSSCICASLCEHLCKTKTFIAIGSYYDYIASRLCSGLHTLKNALFNTLPLLLSVFILASYFYVMIFSNHICGILPLEFINQFLTDLYKSTNQIEHKKL